MWFDASRGDLDSEGDRGIGLATSTDGETWVEYDDPTTSEAPFALSDPVLLTDPGAWDERRAYDPGVVALDDGFAMTYFTRRPGTSSPLYEAGLAFSDDGITWVKDSSNPFFTSNSIGANGVFLSTLASTERGHALYFDVQAAASGGTVMWYQLNDGPLRPTP